MKIAYKIVDGNIEIEDGLITELVSLLEDCKRACDEKEASGERWVIGRRPLEDDLRIAQYNLKAQSEKLLELNRIIGLLWSQYDRVILLEAERMLNKLLRR